MVREDTDALRCVVGSTLGLGLLETDLHCGVSIPTLPREKRRRRDGLMEMGVESAYEDSQGRPGECGASCVAL